MRQRVVARRRFSYAGEARSRGEVFDLEGLRNDDLLLRHGYVQTFEGIGWPCACGREFADEGALRAHVIVDHPEGFDDTEEDAQR